MNSLASMWTVQRVPSKASVFLPKASFRGAFSQVQSPRAKACLKDRGLPPVGVKSAWTMARPLPAPRLEKPNWNQTLAAPSTRVAKEYCSP